MGLGTGSVDPADDPVLALSDFGRGSCVRYPNATMQDTPNCPSSSKPSSCNNCSAFCLSNPSIGHESMPSCAATVIMLPSAIYVCRHAHSNGNRSSWKNQGFAYLPMLALPIETSIAVLLGFVAAIERFRRFGGSRCRCSSSSGGLFAAWVEYLE